MAKKGAIQTTKELIHAGTTLREGAPALSEPCAKCGSLAGWIGPGYVPARAVTVVNRQHPSKVRRTTTTVAEHLQWSCMICGYTRTDKTKDTKDTQ